MRYTSRYSGPALTPEEIDVKTALRTYSTADASCFDWVPSTLLYRAYIHWYGCNRWRFDAEAPGRLTRRQFGRALRRIYPTIARFKRSHDGKPQWGYAGLIGPESVVTRPQIGGRRARLTCGQAGLSSVPVLQSA